MTYFTTATELIERLRDSEDRAMNGEDLCVQAADTIELLLERINHLTNVNDGLRETLDEQRKGLAELRTMVGGDA
jgi:methyl-accepting chemotaxis protein